MNWYAAKIVLQCVVGDEESSTFDMQVRVLRADSDESAYSKAMELGRQVQQQYLNEDDQTVRWVFCGLADLEQLDDEDIVDGTEITSRRVEATSADELVVPKEKLTVVWIEENKHRTAREILKDSQPSQREKCDESGKR